MLSRIVIAYLPRRKHLLISWLQKPSAVILEPKKIKSDTVSTVSPSISHEVMSWPQMKTIVVLKCLLLFYATKMNNLLIGLWHETKSGLHTTTSGLTTSLVVGLTRSSKALPKAKLVLKKVTVTLWWSAASLIHYSFLNPSKTVTSEKSINWGDVPKTAMPAASIAQQNGPNSSPWQHLTTQPMLQQLNELGYEVLPYLL